MIEEIVYRRLLDIGGVPSNNHGSQNAVMFRFPDCFVWVGGIAGGVPLQWVTHKRNDSIDCFTRVYYSDPDFFARLEELLK